MSEQVKPAPKAYQANVFWDRQDCATMSAQVYLASDADSYIDALHAEAEALQSKVTELTNQRDAILLQARCWAGEAKTQQAITTAVGEALGGVPNWGPIAAGVEALRAENAKLRTALAEQGERQEAVAWSLRLPDGRTTLEKAYPKWAEGGDGYAIQPLTTPQPGPDVRGLVEALEVSVDYLDSNTLNSIASGSTCHRKMRNALAAHRQAHPQ